MIVFLEDERAFNEFTSGNFAFSAQAKAIAITAAASATASTCGSSTGVSGGQRDASTIGGFRRGIATSTVARGGLMYGMLVYFFEKACGISGYLLGVNPFDQPGVEAYKSKVFTLLRSP